VPNTSAARVQLDVTPCSGAVPRFLRAPAVNDERREPRSEP
jgi:hypothetical protein